MSSQNIPKEVIWITESQKQFQIPLSTINIRFSFLSIFNNKFIIYIDTIFVNSINC